MKNPSKRCLPPEGTTFLSIDAKSRAAILFMSHKGHGLWGKSKSLITVLSGNGTLEGK